MIRLKKLGEEKLLRSLNVMVRNLNFILYPVGKSLKNLGQNMLKATL